MLDFVVSLSALDPPRASLAHAHVWLDGCTAWNIGGIFGGDQQPTAQESNPSSANSSSSTSHASTLSYLLQSYAVHGVHSVQDTWQELATADDAAEGNRGRASVSNPLSQTSFNRPDKTAAAAVEDKQRTPQRKDETKQATSAKATSDGDTSGWDNDFDFDVDEEQQQEMEHEVEEEKRKQVAEDMEQKENTMASPPTATQHDNSTVSFSRGSALSRPLIRTLFPMDLSHALVNDPEVMRRVHEQLKARQGNDNGSAGFDKAGAKQNKTQKKTKTHKAKEEEDEWGWKDEDEDENNESEGDEAERDEDEEKPDGSSLSPYDSATSLALPPLSASSKACFILSVPLTTDVLQRLARIVVRTRSTCGPVADPSEIDFDEKTHEGWKEVHILTTMGPDIHQQAEDGANTNNTTNNVVSSYATWERKLHDAIMYEQEELKRDIARRQAAFYHSLDEDTHQLGVAQAFPPAEAANTISPSLSVHIRHLPLSFLPLSSTSFLVPQCSPIDFAAPNVYETVLPAPRIPRSSNSLLQLLSKATSSSSSAPASNDAPKRNSKPSNLSTFGAPPASSSAANITPPTSTTSATAPSVASSPPASVTSSTTPAFTASSSSSSRSGFGGLSSLSGAFASITKGLSDHIREAEELAMKQTAAAAEEEEPEQEQEQEQETDTKQHTQQRNQEQQEEDGRRNQDEGGRRSAAEQKPNKPAEPRPASSTAASNAPSTTSPSHSHSRVERLAHSLANSLHSMRFDIASSSFFALSGDVPSVSADGEASMRNLAQLVVRRMEQLRVEEEAHQQTVASRRNSTNKKSKQSSSASSSASTWKSASIVLIDRTLDLMSVAKHHPASILDRLNDFDDDDDDVDDTERDEDESLRMTHDADTPSSDPSHSLLSPKLLHELASMTPPPPNTTPDLSSLPKYSLKQLRKLLHDTPSNQAEMKRDVRACFPSPPSSTSAGALIRALTNLSEQAIVSVASGGSVSASTQAKTILSTVRTQLGQLLHRHHIPLPTPSSSSRTATTTNTLPQLASQIRAMIDALQDDPLLRLREAECIEIAQSILHAFAPSTSMSMMMMMEKSKSHGREQGPSHKSAYERIMSFEQLLLMQYVTHLSQDGDHDSGDQGDGVHKLVSMLVDFVQSNNTNSNNSNNNDDRPLPLLSILRLTLTLVCLIGGSRQVLVDDDRRLVLDMMCQCVEDASIVEQKWLARCVSSHSSSSQPSSTTSLSITPAPAPAINLLSSSQIRTLLSAWLDRVQELSLARINLSAQELIDLCSPLESSPSYSPSFTSTSSSFPPLSLHRSASFHPFLVRLLNRMGDNDSLVDDDFDIVESEIETDAAAAAAAAAAMEAERRRRQPERAGHDSHVSSNPSSSSWSLFGSLREVVSQVAKSTTGGSLSHLRHLGFGSDSGSNRRQRATRPGQHPQYTLVVFVVGGMTHEERIEAMRMMKDMEWKEQEEEEEEEGEDEEEEEGSNDEDEPRKPRRSRSQHSSRSHQRRSSNQSSSHPKRDLLIGSTHIATARDLVQQLLRSAAGQMQWESQ